MTESIWSIQPSSGAADLACPEFFPANDSDHNIGRSYPRRSGASGEESYHEPVYRLGALSAAAV